MAMTKEQRRAYDKAWREKNREKNATNKRKAAKAYYQKNKEKICKQVAEKRKQNPEPHRAQLRKYYHKNREAFFVRRGLGIKLSEAKALLSVNCFRVPASHFGVSNL